MTRIYTRTGDDGTTGLIGGTRVRKDSVRISAYGSVDELNAVLGLARSHELPKNVDATLQRVQDDLFNVGGALAIPEAGDPNQWGILPITREDVETIEREIDVCEGQMEPLGQFILPGGTPAGASLHLARTVARRAERRLVALQREEQMNQHILHYLNRLSDLCFVLARYVNHVGGRTESHPTFGNKQPPPVEP